jgi:hypothetical protein
MKTIGQTIREARTKKEYSYEKLEEITKIKLIFIEAVEKENWKILPAFPTVLGFVKSISSALNIDEKVAVAVLKRDFPPDKTSLNPKPDLPRKPSWSPKLTFAIGLGVIVCGILGYLVFQYIQFKSPPRIEVTSPIDGQVVRGDSVLVFGSADIDAKITVDNQPVLVDDEGNFSVNIDIIPTTSKIIIKATSRSGKETVVERKIELQSNN